MSRFTSWVIVCMVITLSLLSHDDQLSLRVLLSFFMIAGGASVLHWGSNMNTRDTKCDPED